MDLPYNLQTLPSEAVDVLRYYSQHNADSAHADSIVDGTGLSDRGFGKGIRRLVTRNYLVMSSDQVYRLTEQGKRIVEELKAFDSGSPRAAARPDARYLRRHLVLITPRALPVDQPVEVVLGFDEASDTDLLNAPLNMLLRLAVMNGEPRRPHETPILLSNQHLQQSFEINAERFTTARVRVEVCQYRDDGDEFDFCGGMYVDLPVSLDDSTPGVAAYGVDVIIKEEQ